MGYAPVGARVKLNGPLDRRLHEAITNNEFPWEVYRDKQYTMTANEAIGLP